MADAGIVPVGPRDIRERGAFSVARIEEIEQTQHDVIAFTTAVAEHVGPSARWLHFGLTSSDVIDTAQALQLREACDVILKDLDALGDAVRERAMEHRLTAMIGRTHGVHAEPMTFGLKLALWYAELGRDIERIRRARTGISVGKLSGAVGTFAHISPRSRRMSAPAWPRAIPVARNIRRDRHAGSWPRWRPPRRRSRVRLEIRGLRRPR
jgi:adenylosuccinate lyase